MSVLFATGHCRLQLQTANLRNSNSGCVGPSSPRLMPRGDQQRRSEISWPLALPWLPALMVGSAGIASPNFPRSPFRVLAPPPLKKLSRRFCQVIRLDRPHSWTEGKNGTDIHATSSIRHHRLQARSSRTSFVQLSATEVRVTTSCAISRASLSLFELKKVLETESHQRTIK